MSHCRIFLTFCAGFFFACLFVPSSFGAGSLPPKPDHYFSDRAGIVDAATANQINQELANFERETSNQLLVAIFPKVPDGFERDDFTVRTAHAWGVGQRGSNNGAILFVFVADHYVRIEVGYGLEPVLTDATCSLIVRNEIVPSFRRNDYAGGIRAGVTAMMQACRGEFHGTGATDADRNSQAQPDAGVSLPTVGFFIALMLFFGWLSRRRRTPYGNNSSPSQRSTFGGGPWFIGGGGFGGGGSSGRSSGGNDTFSSGGGDFGGGGAGGSW